MSTGTNKERLTQNNGIINENNSDLTALKTRINNLPTSGDTTATASDIALGKTAVSKGVKITGTYTPPTVSLQSKDVTINQNGTTTITADTGYDGLSDVDVTVEGVLDTSDANATAGNIEQGKIAYVKGQKITGELMSVYSTSGNGTIIDYPQYNQVQVRCNPRYKTIIQQGGYVDASISYDIVRNVIGLTANILKKDETVLGVTGTYEGSNNANVTTSEMGADFSGKPNIRLLFVELPNITFANSVTNLQNYFQEATNLKKINSISGTQNVTNMNSMFYYCRNLEDVPLMNTSRLQYANGMFTSCDRITNESLNNILAMCANATNYASTKTLSALGLSSTQATTCQTLSNWDAFVEAGWSSGY